MSAVQVGPSGSQVRTSTLPPCGTRRGVATMSAGASTGTTWNVETTARWSDGHGEDRDVGIGTVDFADDL